MKDQFFRSMKKRNKGTDDKEIVIRRRVEEKQRYAVLDDRYKANHVSSTPRRVVSFFDSLFFLINSRAYVFVNYYYW